MALTARGKVFAFFLVLILIGGGVFLWRALTGEGGLLAKRGSGELPKECPLTGVEAPDRAPDRPALAIKVENLPIARPQAGLEAADVVYEQPVESKISRFIAIYHCRDAERVGPVRSARLVDALAVPQFGQNVVFGYAGSVPQVEKRITDAGITDVNFNIAVDAYTRDPNREQPHNLYTSTSELYAAAADPTGLPVAVLAFDPRVPQRARQVSVIRATYGTGGTDITNVNWRWSEKDNAFLRFHDDVPHTVESGQQLKATNVIVQHVQENCDTGLFDVNGAPSCEIVIVGRGEATVFRNGRAIEGEWVREFPEDITKFVDGQGKEIALAPGNTWIELVLPDQENGFE